MEIELTDDYAAPDADLIYASYLKTCAAIGVEPVARDRAHELVAEWTRVIGEAMRREYGPRSTH